MLRRDGKCWIRDGYLKSIVKKNNIFFSCSNGAIVIVDDSNKGFIICANM